MRHAWQMDLAGHGDGIPQMPSSSIYLGQHLIQQTRNIIWYDGRFRPHNSCVIFEFLVSEFASGKLRNLGDHTLGDPRHEAHYEG